MLIILKLLNDFGNEVQSSDSLVDFENNYAIKRKPNNSTKMLFFNSQKKYWYRFSLWTGFLSLL